MLPLTKRLSPSSLIPFPPTPSPSSRNNLLYGRKRWVDFFLIQKRQIALISSEESNITFVKLRTEMANPSGQLIKTQSSLQMRPLMEIIRHGEWDVPVIISCIQIQPIALKLSHRKRIISWCSSLRKEPPIKRSHPSLQVSNSIAAIFLFVSWI